MVNTRDSAWLAEHSLELSIRYPGKWLAVHDEQIIGIGDTMLQADQQARIQCPQHDYILEQINVALDLPHVD